MTDPSNEPIVCDNEATLEVVEEALNSLWAVANKLSRLKPTRRARFSVSVFGSARIAPGEALYEDVKRLTEALAAKGCDIVTGGGPGLMQAANEGAQLGDPNDETRSIGIRISLPFEKDPNPYVEDAYTHQTFYTRLHQFVRLSDAFVVVGGGIGTTLETLLVWQLAQVGHVRDMPLILVGDMWRGLVDWATSTMLGHDPPLAGAEDMNIPTCVLSIDEAIALLSPLIEAQQQPQPPLGG